MKPTLIAALVLASWAGAAQAEVVLDSFGPGSTAVGWPSLLFQGSAGRQDIAIPFTLSRTTEIESVLTAIDGAGSVTLGVLSRSGSVPGAASWLYSATLVNPAANALLTPAGWSLPAGDYWLAAVAGNGFDGTWQSGTDTPTAPWAYTTANGAWQSVTSNFTGLPAARITVSPVPEPASFALLFAGGLLIAARVRSNANQPG